MLLILACFQLFNVTLRHIAHAIDGSDADVVFEATDEICEVAGLCACLTDRLMFFLTKGLDNVGISPTAGLPNHLGSIGRAVQYRNNILRRTRYW